jgi:hypothetical protein
MCSCYDTFTLVNLQIFLLNSFQSFFFLYFIFLTLTFQLSEEQIRRLQGSDEEEVIETVRGSEGLDEDSDVEWLDEDEGEEEEEEEEESERSDSDAGSDEEEEEEEEEEDDDSEEEEEEELPARHKRK